MNGYNGNGYNNSPLNQYAGARQNIEAENAAYAPPSGFDTFYSQYPFISWFDRSDATLRVINDLIEFSASASYCSDFIVGRSVANGLGIKSKAKGYFSKPKEANPDSPEYQEFSNFITQYFEAETLIEEIAKAGMDLLQFGSALVELKVVKFGGQFAVTIKQHQVVFFRYQSEYGQADKSKGWLFGDWGLSNWLPNSNFSPISIPIYPSYDLQDNVVFRTFMHVKAQGVTNARAVYPMPKWYPSIQQVALEVSLGKFMLRDAKNFFLPVAILESFNLATDTNPQTPNDNILENRSSTAIINNPTTNQGDGKKTNLMTMRQTADTPQSHLMVLPKTLKGEDDRVRMELAGKAIFASFGLPPALLAQASGLGNSTERLEAEKIMEKTVIKKARAEMIKPFNQCIKIATELMGLPPFDFELCLNENIELTAEPQDAANIQGGANV